MKSTNFPRRGTTNEVGGIISASSKKNTVSESKIEILKLTCKQNQYKHYAESLLVPIQILDHMKLFYFLKKKKGEGVA